MMEAPKIDPSLERAAIADLTAHLEALNRHKSLTLTRRAEDVAAERAKTVALSTAGAAGDADAVSQAIHARAAAAHALQVADEVEAAMEARASQLRLAVATARGQAHIPLMEYAEQEAVAACADAEAAFVAHGVAAARYDAARRVAQDAAHAGCKMPFGNMDRIQLQARHPMHPLPASLAKVLRPAALEREVWRGAA